MTGGRWTLRVARGGSLLAVYALLLASAPGAPQAQQPAPPLDVDYVPTPPEVVEAMLKLARVTSADVVYDLGSGDGRIPIAAAKSYGARAVGIDIAAERVAEATANAVAGGVAGKVTFLKQDLFTAAIGDATVVTLYLLPELNLKLLPKLNRELKPGTRVVSHAFDMGDTIKPRQTMNVGGRTIHLFVVPIR